MQDLIFTANYANFVMFQLDPLALENISLTLDQSALLQNHAKRYYAKPLVVDLSAFDKLPSARQLKALWSAFDKRGFVLVGVVHPSAQPDELAGTHLSLIYPLGDEVEMPLPESLQPLQQQVPVFVEAASPPSQPVRATMTIMRNIRSGQSVYAPDADLVIIGMVNSGAEIVADGNVSVFGELRGRAFAGAKGDQSAFIYAHQFGEEVEMLSIANVFKANHQLGKNYHNQHLVQLIDGELVLHGI